jgi:hypothetical protein
MGVRHLSGAAKMAWVKESFEKTEQNLIAKSIFGPLYYDRLAQFRVYPAGFQPNNFDVTHAEGPLMNASRFVPLAALGQVLALVLSINLSQAATIPMLGDAKPFTLFQIGNGGNGDGILEVTSLSTVNGDVAKASSSSGNELKVASSTINGATYRSSGVSLSVSSSTITGGNNADVDLSSAVADAQTAAMDAMMLPGISDTVNLNGTMKTFTATGGPVVINVSGDFILNSGATLRLDGSSPLDFFVFNVAASAKFDIQGSDIELLGHITPMDVLFNVKGVVGGGGEDDAKIQQSLFQGTLLAAGRNVIINDNQYDEGNGLYGAVIAGNKLLFAESDITHDPFMPIPEPATIWLVGLGLALAASARRR